MKKIQLPDVPQEEDAELYKGIAARLGYSIDKFCEHMWGFVPLFLMEPVKQDVPYPCDVTDNRAVKVFLDMTEDQAANAVKSLKQDAAFRHELDNIEKYGPNYKEEKIVTSVDLHQTMDAITWASEFQKTIAELAHGKSSIVYGLLDPKFEKPNDFLVAWFANAIMCGYDHANWRRNKEYIYLFFSKSSGLIKIFHWEPSIKELDREYSNYLNCDYQDGIAKPNCYLQRWSLNKGLQVWDGDAEDSLYSWKTSI